MSRIASEDTDIRFSIKLSKVRSIPEYITLNIFSFNHLILLKSSRVENSSLISLNS